MTEALWGQVISALSGLAAMALSAYLARWTARKEVTKRAEEKALPIQPDSEAPPGAGGMA